jgi:putative glutamine amidotransferase
MTQTPTQTPRIAVPEPTSTDAAYNQRSLPQYVRVVEAAGGIAVSIPLSGPREAQLALLASCAAILLPGSPADVDPTRYGQEPVKECAPKDVPREAADDLLLQDAFQQGKPVLGICYGLQSLNVWRRGTLIQDLPQAAAAKAASGDSSHGPVNHTPGREVQNAHSVRIFPGSVLSQVLANTSEGNAGEMLVNSSHHQAIGGPGARLKVTATSPIDGVIEALEGETPGQFVVAVQWHPERTYETSAPSRALFAAFLQAARSWMEFRVNPEKETQAGSTAAPVDYGKA